MEEQVMPVEETLPAHPRVPTGFRYRFRSGVCRSPGILKGKEGLIFAIGLVLVWQAVSQFSTGQHRFLFPSPAVIAGALWDSLPELLRGTWYSFLILVPGYLLAVFTGIFWGVLVGTTGWLQRAFNPFARVAAPIPPTIYIPYAIALLSTFRTSAVFVVYIGAFWPVFLNTSSGAAAVPAKYRDDAAILGLSRAEYLWRVVFPACLPHSFSGMSVGLALSFILLTVAELFGANAGLGRFVQYYADFADYPRMVAGIVYTGLITFISMELLERIKRRALFWVR
ncbi:MAG: ABC transporter permease [Syntrophobacteraceae bacterium]|jgi:NitT/TauT family transport system permease protein